jgi:phage tail tape-measure protein
MKKTKENTTDTNPDPITGEPGSHPLGTGVGAAITGAAAGMAGGALGGPIGAAAGAAIGAVAGGYAGKAVEEQFDPTAEDAYWRANYRNRPYVEKNAEYEAYRPAYQYGWESRRQYRDRAFDDLEPTLESGWRTRATGSSLEWERAKQAARDAWNRVDRASAD